MLSYFTPWFLEWEKQNHSQKNPQFIAKTHIARQAKAVSIRIFIYFNSTSMTTATVTKLPKTTTKLAATFIFHQHPYQTQYWIYFAQFMGTVLPWSSFWQIHFPRQRAVNRNTDVVALPVSPCGEASTSQQSSEKYQKAILKRVHIPFRFGAWFNDCHYQKIKKTHALRFFPQLLLVTFLTQFFVSFYFSWTGLTARLDLARVFTIAYDHWRFFALI